MHHGDLGNANNLANPDSYSKAHLGEAGRAPATPPPWELTLQVDTTQDTARPDTLRVRVLLSNTTTETGRS